MILTRRAALEAIFAGAVAQSAFPSILRAGTPVQDGGRAPGVQPGEPWSAEWDRAIIAGNLRQKNKNYDPQEHMLLSHLGPEYNYQSQLRNTAVHPIRDSIEYALVLLETGGDQRAQTACQVIERTLQLQDGDPASKWFGLWSYYLEEPLAKMGAVDFNAADFNGSLLLLILYRHGSRIPESTKQKIYTGIRQACVSIRIRDITPHYTNIIAQGSFVILAAAELFSDKDLLNYGLGRMRHWAQVVDESGSFTEYNSPHYTTFALENLLRMRSIVRNPEALGIAERLERRAWEELAQHWHAPTMQLAGPMSRTYSNDIDNPLWLQKGLDNRFIFQTRQELETRGGDLPPAILPYRCPDDLREFFLELRQPRQHREVFIPASVLIDTFPSVPFTGTIEPVEGTTFLAPHFALGSCNRSDFWVQRRPLLAYWGGNERPPKWMQLRVIKDDYDFSSALFHSVQEGGMVLGAIGFRSDGGDRHPLIDRIRDGKFSFKTMVAEIQIGGWVPSYKALFNGKEVAANATALPADTRISIDTGSCRIGFQFHHPVFTLAEENSSQSPPKIEWIPDQAIFRLTLIDRTEEKLTQWQQVQEALCGFTCFMSEKPQSLAEFDAELAAMKLVAEDTPQSRTFTWTTASASGSHTLSVTTLRAPRPFNETETAFSGRIDGKPMPAVRLSDRPILNS